jgi:hypothetical protein
MDVVSIDQRLRGDALMRAIAICCRMDISLQLPMKDTV